MANLENRRRRKSIYDKMKKNKFYFLALSKNKTTCYSNEDLYGSKSFVPLMFYIMQLSSTCAYW